MNKSYYYSYAQQNIRCECPLCLCPSQNGMKYSFVYICENRKLIYYDIPKNASNTIRQLFFDKNDSLSLLDPQRELKEYFKFTFIRNPWDRLVSNWKMFTNRPFRVKQLNSMAKNDVSKFEDFVYFAYQNHNHHWQPQICFLPEKLDFIGRTESFDADYNQLCRLIGESPKKVDRLNSTERKSYWEYYTPSLVDFVAEMYSEDINEFGYEFTSEKFICET